MELIWTLIFIVSTLLHWMRLVAMPRDNWSHVALHMVQQR